MIVFIDDSGDAGFQIEKGSSRFFVISCVIFDDDLEAEKVSVALKQLKRDLKSKKIEFKFNKCDKKERKEFLKTVNKFEFKIRALVIDKKKIKSEYLKKSKESFYGYAIKSVLKNNKDTILDAKVRIDGSGGRQFRKTFQAYLRRELNLYKPVMKNCKLIDSKENILIQMADMIAGTIRRYYDPEKTDKTDYRSLIKKKIDDEWLFQ